MLPVRTCDRFDGRGRDHLLHLYDLAGGPILVPDCDELRVAIDAVVAARVGVDGPTAPVGGVKQLLRKVRSVPEVPLCVGRKLVASPQSTFVDGELERVAVTGRAVDQYSYKGVVDVTTEMPAQELVVLERPIALEERLVGDLSAVAF